MYDFYSWSVWFLYLVCIWKSISMISVQHEYYDIKYQTIMQNNYVIIKCCMIFMHTCFSDSSNTCSVYYYWKYICRNAFMERKLQIVPLDLVVVFRTQLHPGFPLSNIGIILLVTCFSDSKIFIKHVYSLYSLKNTFFSTCLNWFKERKL